MTGAAVQAMRDLDAQVERVKLARMLHVDDGELAFLDAVDPAHTRHLRERVTDLAFAQGDGHFDRLLAASRLLPNPVVAAIAQRVFPALICAQLAASLEGARSAVLIRHFRVDFVADVARHLDPRFAGHLIPELPDDVMIEVAAEINRRRDFVTAGRLVGHAPDRVLPQLIAAIPDERDLIEIAWFLEDRARLDPIVRHIPSDRLTRLLAAAEQHDLWPQALSLATHLSEHEGTRLATLMAEAPAHRIDSLLEATHARHLWPALLPLVALMADGDLGGVVNRPLLRRREVLEAVLVAAQEVDGWDTLVRVVAAMDADTQAEVAAALPPLDGTQLMHLLRSVTSLRLGGALGAVDARLDAADG